MSPQADSSLRTAVDAIVIGAGFGGLAAAYRLREAGLRVQAFDKGSDVGGTWHWNRYPGARTDSEASIYRLEFFDDLVGPWRFSERFPGQPEVHAYLSAVADKLDLRRLYRFSTAVTAAAWHDDEARWHVETDDGGHWVAKYLMSAAGIMSAPIRPDIPGLEDFEGRVLHTAEWPQEPVQLDGLRVALFGTGSSGIQAIPEVAKAAGHLTVFQRTPNYSVPVKNHALDPDHHEAFEQNMEAVRAAVRASPFSMPYEFSGRSALAVDDAERRRIFEEAWEKGGFRFLIEAFDDIAVDKAANDHASEFLRDKIREIVHDRTVADALCPTYPYTVKRPPSGTAFFEAFNRENVDLVDLRQKPIVRATAKGLETADGEQEFDVIIFATGFDFLTGALYQMDVRGRDGISLQERWHDELAIYLSLALAGFPNLFMIGGPLYPGGNWPTVAEQISRFVGRLVARAEEVGAERVEVRADIERAWVDHANEVAAQTLMYTYGDEANAYGFGANIDGKLRTVHFYMGGAQNVFDRMDEEEGGGYPGFELTAANGSELVQGDPAALSETEPESAIGTNV